MKTRIYFIRELKAIFNNKNNAEREIYVTKKNFH